MEWMFLFLYGIPNLSFFYISIGLDLGTLRVALESFHF